MSKIPAINEIDANSPSQESKEVVVKATDVSPDINEVQETISSAATIQEVDGTRKPTISEIYKIVTDGLFESTSNWWDYAYKLSQAQINQDIISRLDKGEIGGGYSKGVDIITTTKDAIPTNANVYSALKSDTLYPKKLNNETINGIYNFVNGITIGKPTAYTGGTWSVDQLGKTHLSTDYLYVRLKAIFETLQILNVDTIGGKLVISPAGSITIVYVDNIKVTIDDNEQNVYRCYFLGEQEGEEIENKWKVGDQAQAKSFNVKKGTYHKIGNHYLWRLVVGASTDTVTIDGKKYHYVDLSQLIFDVGSDAPAPGDVLNQLGHRGDDLQRQTAIVLNAVDNYAPSITLYAGINDFTLLNKEYVEYGVYQGKAFFNVYGDMYIGDKGSNPTTYIKYKNGKIDIKANLTIGSSIDGKDLDKYIKENGGVDEKTVISLINNSQVIKDLQNQADGAIETWFYEGEPTLKNLPAVDWTTNELKKIHTGDLYYDQNTGFAYRFTKYNDDINPYAWNRIKDNDIVKALEAANKAQATADSKMKIFYGETKPTDYQAGDMWVNATLAGKFDNDIARSTTTSKTFDANHWVLASRYSEAIQNLLNWSNQYTTKFEDLTKVVKEQKDKSISNWFYDYEPTIDNEPANLWNTEELRSEHIGDIFYDTKNNHSYRWTGSAWSMIKDADFDEAMKKAKEAADLAGDANDLADKKRQIFYSNTTPTGGDRGDLWIKQVGTKTEVWVFDGTNWVKSNDKALADYSEAINKELQGIKGQLDGKAETWYQADDPSTNWTNKTSHEGDIWYNTTDGTTQYWNGTKWEKMDIPKDVFDTIDGKSSIFVDSYDDAKAGKGVISNGYNERDIWILPADAIVNGVQYYKGDILTAIVDGTVFNEKHWIKKVRYVGDKELTTTIDEVNKKINDISATTLLVLDNKFNEFAKDGILDSSEKSRLTDLLNQANNDVLAANDQITSIIKSDYLTNDNVNKGKLIEAQKTLSTAWNEYKTLITTLIASENSITKNNIAEASSKYTNLQNSIKAVKQYLAACQADMLSNIGIDINSYKYLKEAFKGKTEVNGGLVVTNVLQLRQTSDANSPITAGISGLQGKANENGVVDKDTYDITSIAAWFGGPMVDKNIFTDEQLVHKVAGTDYARSLFRHDGSGYLASGAIYWGTDGILHGNPNSFILQGTSLATMFNYIRLFYLHYGNTNDEGIAGIDYITPTKTFSRLDILTQGGTEAGLNLPTGLFIGSSTTGGSFQVGNIIIRTKKGDPNILEIVSATSGKTAHLGVQGGISAYGTYTSSTGGGGGLNATVVSYANIIAGNYNDADLTNIPNAYSIKALYNAIQNIDVSGQLGNYLLKTDAANTYQPKGNYLTAHQIIYGLTIQKNGANVGTYNPKLKDATIDIAVPTKVSELTNDSGYTNNTGTVTSVGISVPTGLSATNSPITTKGIIAITFAQGYSIPTIAKQTSWDNISTFESYFNNGSAKEALQLTNARKLWGNAFNGTADVNGSIVLPNGKYISIGNIKLEYDATNKALKITNTETDKVANLYASGGVSAYGVGSVASSGGGLNGSVLSYDLAIKLTSAGDNELSQLASAWSIAKLNSRISSLEDGSALDVVTSGTGNAVTGISKNGTTINVTKGTSFLTSHQSLANYLTKTDASNTYLTKSAASSTYQPKGNYLTAHQSLDDYINNIVTSGAGNAITSVTKSGKTVTFTKGATYLTAHQSLAAYATQNWVKNEATAHNADMVDNYHASALFTGFSISDVANLVTISIGGASRSLNLVRAFPIGVGNNFNDIATHGNSMGMSNIAAPYASSTANYQTLNGYVNPNGQTGWHHYINISYTDSNNTATSPNMCQTQFAIKAGTTEVYVRSRAGGKISNDAAWAAPWVRLARVTDNVASASKVANALSWSGYSSGSYNGSAAKSISIPNNTNQLTNGAGFITASGSITGNAATATHATSASYIRNNGLPSPANNTVKAYKDSLVRFFKDYYPNSGVGANVVISASIIRNWSNDSATFSPSSDYSFIKIGGAYSGTQYGQYMLSTYKLERVGIVGRNENEWTAIKWLAYTDDIPTKLSQFTNDKNFVTGSVNGQTITINGVSTTWQNTWRGITDSYSGTATSISLSQKGANSLYNALYNGYASSAGNANTVGGYYESSFLRYRGKYENASVTKDGVGVYGWAYTNEGHNNFHESYGDIINIQGYSTWRTRFDIGISGRIRIMHGINTTTATQVGYLAYLHDNVASATKLQTPRSIWGQSFNGTANVSGSITGVDNITMSNNSYLYGKNTSGTAIQLIAMASWNSVDIGRGALTYGYTTQVMGKTVAFTASNDSGKNIKSVELSITKLYSNVNIETEGGFLAHGGVTAYSSSDIRLKQNLHKLNYLNIIKAMGGSYGFTWIKDNKHSIGWIAQHVLTNPYMRDIVETDENGYYKINYWSPKLIATAFGAIEQVDDEVSKLKARVKHLEAEVERLTNDNKLLISK